MNKSKFLSPIELEHLKQTLEKFRDQDTRNVTLIETLLYTGSRATEVLNITKADLNSEDQTVFIKGLKNSRDREVPLKKPLFDALMALCRTSNRPFDISYSRLVQVWELYRPCRKSVHCTRHTFAIEIFKAKRDLRFVQLCLGHKSIQSTMVYSDYIYSREEMSSLLDMKYVSTRAP